MDDQGNGHTRLRWTLEYSGLDARGRMIVAEPGFEARVFGMLDLLALSAKHYVETGEKYRVPKMRRAKVLTSVVGALIGRHVRYAHRGTTRRCAPT